MRINRMRFRYLGIVIAPLLAACYVQRPLTAPVPEASSRIVVQITDTGRAELANQIGPGASEVEGVVVSANDSAWDLEVLRVGYRVGPSQQWNRERVTFPRYALTNASERSLSRKKSWIMALAITGTALLAAKAFGALGFGGSGGGEPPPPN
jgi:hypothetical protein